MSSMRDCNGYSDALVRRAGDFTELSRTCCAEHLALPLRSMRV